MVETIFSRNFNVLLETRHLLAIILACLCGWAIGYERKSRNKQAGIHRSFDFSVNDANF